jgi:ADP-heptose:LPS heptosyltransferase
MSRPKAVVLRALGLGDFVTGLPALAMLRQALPAHRLVLAAPARFGALLPLGVPVDELVPTGELEPIPVHGPVDVGVDLHGNGPASRRLIEQLRPRRVVGFGGRSSLVGPPWRADEHEVARWCRLISETFRVPMPVDPSVAGALRHPPASTPSDAVIIHPGAAAPARRWPVDRFAAIARRLLDASHDVTVTGTPEENALVAEVARTGARPVTGMSLVELCGSVASAPLILSGDTGIAHLAAAYRTPSVVLMGPVSPTQWGPPEDPRHVVLWHGAEGDPHADRPHSGLLTIGVDEVWDAVTGLLDRSTVLVAERSNQAEVVA